MAVTQVTANCDLHHNPSFEGKNFQEKEIRD